MLKESARKTFMCVLIGVVIVLALVVIPKLQEKEEAGQPPVTSVTTTVETETGGEDLVLLSTSSEEPEQITESVPEQTETVDYKFRNKNLLNSHFEKHGEEMGFKTAADYEAAASAVVNNPEALHKLEKEDGDDIYYIEATNEFVIVSKDGYIRTYFNPDDGINYYNRK